MPRIRDCHCTSALRFLASCFPWFMFVASKVTSSTARMRGSSVGSDKGGQLLASSSSLPEYQTMPLESGKGTH